MSMPVRCLLCALAVAGALHARPYLQQQQQLSHAPSLSRSRRAFVVAEQGLDIGRRSKDWLDGVGEFMSAFKIPKLEEDTMAEAVALNSALDETAQLDSLESQLGRMSSLANLTLSYYKAAGSRIANAPAVQSRMDGVFVAVNGVIVLLVLRLFLPRLLAIQTMQDLYDCECRTHTRTRRSAPPTEQRRLSVRAHVQSRRSSVCPPAPSCSATLTMRSRWTTRRSWCYFFS